MNEAEVIDAMKTGLKEADKLLDHVAQISYSSSSTCTLNSNSSNQVIPRTDLDSFRLSLRNESNVEGMRDAISNILHNHHKVKASRTSTETNTNRLDIPLPLLGLKDARVLPLQPCDLIEDTLKSYDVNITIHQFDDVCSESLYVENEYLKKDDVVSDHDVGVVDAKDLSLMKSKHRAKWEKVSSNLEFQSLTRQIYQIISCYDLQLTAEDIDELAKQAICIALAWKQVCNIEDVSNVALNKCFGKSDRGKYFFKEAQQSGKNSNKLELRCHFGTQQWGDAHFGIGMLVEMDRRFDVLWKSKAQASEESDLDTDNGKSGRNDSEYVTSLTCCLQQGFPLAKNESDQCSLLFDSVTTHDDYFRESCNTSAFLDTSIAKLSIVFNEGIFWKDKCKQETKEQPENNMLGDIVKSVDSEKQNEEKRNLFGTEVYAWGDNTCNCLGIGRNQSSILKLTRTEKEPSMISFSPISSYEPVESIACSSCHTMILTRLGNVYSCGDGSDGQLGHNSLESLSHFQLVDFSNCSPGGERIVVTDISAGSDDTSSHSAAIDSEHNLYTWGKSILCGHVGTDKNLQSNIMIPKLVKAFENEDVVQVSCGGGFTLVRTLSNEPNSNIIVKSIYSWGKTARGRLGIGKPKLLRKGSRVDSSLQVPWYQCYPIVLDSLKDEEIIDISAGSKHALAVNSYGQVFSWGSNSSGECSAVKTKQPSTSSSLHNNLWDDVWIPRKIPFFGNDTTKIRAKKVSAGGIHSSVIDSNGLVYTWGGGGHGGCLGHGDISEYEYGIVEKMDASRRQFQAMSGYLEVPKWAVPRLLEVLSHCKAAKVALGAKHGVVVTESGGIYSWGDQTCNISQMDVLQSTPSHPSENRLQALQGKYVENAACGYDRTFCITSGSAFGRNVGALLLHQCGLFHRAIAVEDYSTVLQNQNLIDCTIISGVHKIYCHKVILASRCDVLKDMILDEERPEERITEILIPGIQFNTMKQIIDFFYTDTIDFTNLSSLESTLNLLEGALMLKLSSLEAICVQILTKIYEYDHTGSRDECDHQIIGSTLPVDLSTYLLQQESKFADIHVIALKDNSIIHAHKCILRCASDCFRSVLDNESEHWMELENPTSTRNNVTTIKIPGNRAEAMRMLYYLYTGVVPTTAGNAVCNDVVKVKSACDVSEDIKSDIIHAEKFKLKSMKAQSENAIIIKPTNSLNVLSLSYEVNSSKLKLDALNVICKMLTHYHGIDNEGRKGHDMDCLDLTSWKEELGTTLLKCPGYAEDLFEKIKALNSKTLTPKDRREIAIESLEVKKEKKKKVQQRMIDDVTDSEMIDRSFVMKLVITFVTVLGYLMLQSMIKFHPFVTVAVNISFLILTTAFLLQRL